MPDLTTIEQGISRNLPKSKRMITLLRSTCAEQMLTPRYAMPIHQKIYARPTVMRIQQFSRIAR